MSNWVENDVASSAAARDVMAAQSAFFKPPVGTSYIRSLPPHKNMIDPNTGKPRFYEPVCLHFGVGPGGKGQPVPCPRRMLKLECPICSFAFQLKDQGREREGQDLLPSWAGYINVVQFNKEGEPIRNKAGEIEVKIWSAGRKTLDKLFKQIENYEQEHDLDPNSINIADPKKGLTIKIVREGTTRDDTTYDIFVTKSIDVMPFVDEWDDKLIDVTKTSPMLTAAQLKTLMTGENDDPYAGTAAKQVPAKSSFFDDEEPAVAGEYREVTEEEQSTRQDAQERLKAMVAAKNQKKETADAS